MVSIRSASYTSSYTSPTLTIPTPSTMVPGDFLLCLLFAVGKYSGNYYGSVTAGVVGNPAPGWSLLDVPITGPVPGDQPHDAPVAVLTQTDNAHPWRTITGGVPTDEASGWTGSWWVNLGARLDTGDWDTTGTATWPFQRSWMSGEGSYPGSNLYSACLCTITATGRLVTGSEPPLQFTLNIPNDSEYDYRGIALCFTAVDWGGMWYINPSSGGASGFSDFEGATTSWSTTGSRPQEFASGRHTYMIGAGQYADSGGGHYYGINLRTLDAYLPQSFWSTWPPDLTAVADPSSPVAGYASPPPEDLDIEDLILHVIAYAGEAAFGDPTAIVVSDQSATSVVSPLPVLHQETWTKTPNTLHVRLSQTRPTSDHAVEPGGSGIVTLTSPIIAPEGPITLPSVTWNPSFGTQLYTVGLALTLRIRRPYPPPVAIPSRLATIVG